MEGAPLVITRITAVVVEVACERRGARQADLGWTAGFLEWLPGCALLWSCRP